VRLRRAGASGASRRAGSLSVTAVIYSISVILVLGLWWQAARSYNIPLLSPTPQATFARAKELFDSGTLVNAAAASMRRVVLGFLIGGSLGVVAGLLLGVSSVVRSLFEPQINFFRFIPVFAWFGPILLWVGANEMSLLILIAYATFFVVTVNTSEGVAQVPRNATRMAQVYGAKRVANFFYVVFPSTMPHIVTGLRLAVANSFMAVVAAEFLQANKGLGVMLATSQSFYDMAEVFTVIISLGILGFTADRLFVLGANLLVRRYLPAGRLR
jgi:NitT/TauT family transport system permease protein